VVRFSLIPHLGHRQFAEELGQRPPQGHSRQFGAIDSGALGRFVQLALGDGANFHL
jgi:hypothetical protein